MQLAASFRIAAQKKNPGIQEKLRLTWYGRKKIKIWFRFAGVLDLQLKMADSLRQEKVNLQKS